MQERVTQKNQGGRIIFYTILMVTIILLVITLSVTISIKKKNNIYFNARTYYFVYTHRSKNEDYVKVNAQRVKLLGGAGVIFKFNEDYFLLASAYSSRAEAEEVFKNNEANFPDGGVLELPAKKFKSKSISEIRQNEIALKFFELCDEVSETLTELVAGYLSGKISDSKILSTILKYDLKFKEICENFSQKNDANEKVFESLCLCIENFEYFLDNFYSSTKKESLVCELLVSHTLIRFKMSNNL